MADNDNRTPATMGRRVTVTDQSGEIAVECTGTSELVKLVFDGYQEDIGPLVLKIRGPSGKVTCERILREVPTGRPQSPPPVTLTLLDVGDHSVDIRPLKAAPRTAVDPWERQVVVGSRRGYLSTYGRATLHVESR